MSYAKPIWNEVQSCHYSKPPSWGGRDDVRMSTFTGSSSSNSHFLAEIQIRRRFYINFVVFNYILDDKLIKQNIHLRNKDKAGEFIQKRKSNFLNSMNEMSHPINKKLKTKK